MYPDPVPVPVGNIFPESFDTYGVSGKPVTESALRLIVAKQNRWFEYADPLRHNLESVLEALLQIGENDNDPRSDAAIVAHHTLCYRLVFNSSADLLLAFSGVFRYRKSFKIIHERLPADMDEFSKALLEYERIDRFRKLIKSRWLPRYEKIKDVDLSLVLSGEVDQIKQEVELTRELQSNALAQ
jgi:hypothetical protein